VKRKYDALFSQTKRERMLNLYTKWHKYS